MSISAVSNVSKTISSGILPRKERSLTRTKRPPEDGFQLIYSVNCEAAGLGKFPSITVLPAEPISWLSQPVPIGGPERRGMSRSVSRIVQATSFNQMAKTSTESKRSLIQNFLKKWEPRPKFVEKYEILAVYNSPENEGCINMLIYKDFALEDEIMGVLQKSLTRFLTLKVLRFEYCNLTSDHIKAIKWILRKCANITEVSVDGNPIKRQNYYILLRDVYLESLSLRFCKIDYRGLPKLADCLYFCPMSVLIALDLSNNFVGDEGCRLLAKALRTNRTLTHLSLANNLISDTGCGYLLDVLQKFSLTHEEVLLKRKMNTDYLLRYKMVYNTVPGPKPIPPIPSLMSQHNRSIAKLDRKKSSVQMRLRKEKTSMASVTSLRRLKRKTTSTGSTFMVTVAKDPHPFMHECVHEKKEVFCRGNFKLLYLNLAYNSISCEKMKDLNNMLAYQLGSKGSKGSFKPSLQVFLEGNPIVRCSNSQLSGPMVEMVSSYLNVVQNASNRKLLTQSR